jgi:hypothetical protein
VSLSDNNNVTGDVICFKKTSGNGHTTNTNSRKKVQQVGKKTDGNQQIGRKPVGEQKTQKNDE